MNPGCEIPCDAVRAPNMLQIPQKMRGSKITCSKMPVEMAVSSSKHVANRQGKRSNSGLQDLTTFMEFDHLTTAGWEMTFLSFQCKFRWHCVKQSSEFRRWFSVRDCTMILPMEHQKPDACLRGMWIIAIFWFLQATWNPIEIPILKAWAARKQVQHQQSEIFRHPCEPSLEVPTLGFSVFFPMVFYGDGSSWVQPEKARKLIQLWPRSRRSFLSTLLAARWAGPCLQRIIDTLFSLIFHIAMEHCP